VREISTTETAHKKAEKMLVSIIKSLRYDKHTSRVIKCPNCGYTTEVQDQTFSRWFKKGQVFCGICNNAQKNVPDEVKVAQLNDRRPEAYKSIIKVEKYLGYNTKTTQAYCEIKFLGCGHTKEYSTTTLGSMMRKGKAFKCDICGTSKQGSAIEDVVSRYLPSFERQVPYACIGDTKRRWVADFYKDNIIIEVSTGNTRSQEEYSTNLEEKRLWCKSNGIKFILISDINTIKDIVHDLEKSRD
jgi:transcription elongation factor Elf1